MGYASTACIVVLRRVVLVDHLDLPPNFQDSRSNQAHGSSSIGKPGKEDQSDIASAIGNQNLSSDGKCSESSKSHEHPASGEVSSIILGLAHLAHAHRAETEIASRHEAENDGEDYEHCGRASGW